MNAVLMVVVTAVVLLMTALTLIFITQGGLSNFLETAKGQEAQGVCRSNRDQYCSLNGNGLWDSQEATYNDIQCNEHLSSEERYWNCSSPGWVGSTNDWQPVGTATSQ